MSCKSNSKLQRNTHHVYDCSTVPCSDIVLLLANRFGPYQTCEIICLKVGVRSLRRWVAHEHTHTHTYPQYVMHTTYTLTCMHVLCTCMKCGYQNTYVMYSMYTWYILSYHICIVYYC